MEDEIGKYCKTCPPSGCVIDCSKYDIYYNSSIKEKRETICLDACIIPEIIYLWEYGVTTFGCCCGHGKCNANALVSVDSKKILESLGYNLFEYTKEHTEVGCYYITLKTNNKHVPIDTKGEYLLERPIKICCPHCGERL